MSSVYWNQGLNFYKLYYARVLFTSCFGSCGSRAEVVSCGNFGYPCLSSVLFTYGDKFELKLLFPGLVNMFLLLQSSRLLFGIINTDFFLLGISPRKDLTKRTFYRSKNFPSLIELCCEKGKFTERACTANVILRHLCNLRKGKCKCSVYIYRMTLFEC